METREELIRRAEQGKAVSGLIGSKPVQAVFAGVRERWLWELMRLDPLMAGEFTRLKAKIDAIDEFSATLSILVEQGKDAEKKLAQSPGEDIARLV